MRLLIIVMTLALFVAVLGFLVTNLETRIPLQIWQTVHPDVPLYLIVILAVVVGVIYAGIIAAAEGAATDSDAGRSSDWQDALRRQTAQRHGRHHRALGRPHVARSIPASVMARTSWMASRTPLGRTFRRVES